MFNLLSSFANFLKILKITVDKWVYLLYHIEVAKS